MYFLGRHTPDLENWDTFAVADDFDHFVTTDRWTSVLTDTGTAAVSDGAFGVLKLTPSDATVADNDEVYVRTTTELFLLDDNQPLYAKGKLSFVETASGVYNAFFGFANAIAADLIVDNGGLRTTGNIVALEKRDGETAWRLTTRNDTASTSTLSTHTTTMASGVFQVVEIIAVPGGSIGKMAVSAKVNDAYLKDSAGRVIVHELGTGSPTLMHFGFGAKLGAVTNNDALLVDRVHASQSRRATA